MREARVLVAGAVLAVPFVVGGWLEAWPVGVCAAVMMVVYAVCGWSALRAHRVWQAEVAEERRRKRAEASLWSQPPVNVRVIAQSVNSTPTNPVFTGSMTRDDVVRVLEPQDAPFPKLVASLASAGALDWREDVLFCRECGEQYPGHLGSCSSSAMQDHGHPFHEARP